MTSSIGISAAATKPFESWPLALGAGLLMTVHWMDRQAFVALSPSVSAELHLSDRQYGWLSAAFSITFLLAGPFAGHWIDRIGARIGLVVAIVAWSVVSAAHSLAAGFVSLLVLRLALGAFEAPSFPGALQTVRRVLPGTSRSAGTGLLGVGAATGGIVSPLVAIGVASRLGWRAAFSVTAAAGLLWIPLWLFLARSPQSRAAMAGTGSGEPENPGAAIPFRRIFKKREVFRSYVAELAIFPIFSLLNLWSAKFLTARYGLTQADLRTFLIVGPAFYSIGTIGFGWLGSRTDRRRSQAGGVVGRPKRLLFALASLATMSGALAAPFADGAIASVAFIGLAVAGCGGVINFAASDLTFHVPPGQIATAAGAFITVQSIVFIIANPIVGELVTRTGGYTAPFLSLSACTAIGAIAWLALARPLHSS